MRPLATLVLGALCAAGLGVAAESSAAPPAGPPAASPPGKSAQAPPSGTSSARPPRAPAPPSTRGTSPGAGKGATAGKGRGASKPPPKKAPAARPGARSARNATPAKTRGGPPRKPRVVFDQGWAATPSARYAALDRDACHAELRARNVTFTVVAEAAGVEAPVRLPGDVAGVVWRTELPAADRAHAPWDVVDCRVVLSLHDWSPRLRGRGITEVLLFSAWRPPPASWPKDEPATRHPGALAIDVKRMIREPDPATGAPRKDLDVDRDWDPRLGAPVCGPGAPAPSPATEEAKELRAIACEVDDARLFTVVLTPHYDRAHHNHLHLEITPDVTWRLTR